MKLRDEYKVLQAFRPAVKQAGSRRGLKRESRTGSADMKYLKWAATAAALLIMPTLAMAQTQVRIMWYSDGNEGNVMQDLLNRFQQQNTDIKIEFDQVPYNTILQNLPE